MSLMNKMLFFPLSILLILTIIGFLSDGNLVGSGFTTETNGTVKVNGSESTYSSDYGGTFVFDLFTGDGLIITLGLIVTAVVLLGIGVFGSGLSIFSQTLVLQSVVFLGLWGALILFSKDFIINNTGPFGVIMYFILTVIYGIGFVLQITSSAGE